GITFVSNGPNELEYTQYANNHWYELIDNYDPILLWNDIGYPPNTNVYEIFAYFYNKHPDGIVNDRWRQFHKSQIDHPPVRHYDFRTPEYEKMPEITKYKWESCRGVSYSFGYNKMETVEDYLAAEDLIKMLIDIVSKNGNLLLNVGPMADGTIPDLQKNAILGLGNWLDINGEAIYGTRPWEKAEGKTSENIDLRFTKKGDILYIHLLEKPAGIAITIQSLTIPDSKQIKLLGSKENLSWKLEGENIKVSLPERLFDSAAYVLKVY
ncbi:MAG: alpha-L-fucosidase, partial [Promethearchaeota archaeon]